MKAFWGLIAALALITGGMLMQQSASDGSSPREGGTTTAEPERSIDENDTLAMNTVDDGEVEVEAGEENAATVDDDDAAMAGDEADATIANDDEVDGDAESDAPGANDGAAPTIDELLEIEPAPPIEEDDRDNGNASPAVDAELRANAPAEVRPGGGDAAAGGTAEQGEVANGESAESGETFSTGIEKVGEFPVKWSKLVRRDDGAIVANDRFIIKGSGAADDPYRVTWDLLLSAEEAFQPREGLKRVPEHVAMLHDKYVQITGYVAFPIAAANANEMLAMLNQWDGCCIGLPPSPYDAVEVKLKDDATPEQLAMSYGVVTGRLRVDPYLTGDWLLGLYVMNDAELRKN
ncbi:MAG: hypothetical protein ACF8PN_08505 [Phycisphaerales bacterium]